MPFMKNGKRDYKRQLAWEKKEKPHMVKDRAKRNAARSQVAKKLGKTPTQIKGDVAHKRALSKAGSNTLGNLFVQSKSGNRSFSRNKNGSMKSERSRRERG
jgi:transposase